MTALQKRDTRLFARSRWRYAPPRTPLGSRVVRSIAAVWAIGAATGPARAADDATSAPTARPNDPREVVLAVGYGAIVLPGGFDSYSITDKRERATTLDALAIDVTRRVAWLEYGARFWRSGGSSDGRGASAHVLTRWTTQARLVPWRFRTIEPWMGAELGLALADDYAIWNKTENEPERRAVGGVRPGLVAGLEAGARVRVSTLLAFGLRGGPLFLGFDRAPSAIAPSAAEASYFVRPTDYGRRVWISLGLTAELTVPDGAM